MNVSTGECPGNAVAGMDPKFVRKKRNRLFGHVCALPADGGLPILLSLSGVEETQKRRQQSCVKDLFVKSLEELHRETSKIHSDSFDCRKHHTHLPALAIRCYKPLVRTIVTACCFA